MSSLVSAHKTTSEKQPEQLVHCQVEPISQPLQDTVKQGLTKQKTQTNKTSKQRMSVVSAVDLPCIVMLLPIQKHLQSLSESAL